MGPAESLPTKDQERFARVAWGVLVYNVLVVLWGAFVRASGSGAGCGGHWPLCNGDLVPRAPALETLIEFTHRITSGLSLVAVFGLLVWSRRAFPSGHRTRLFAGLSAVFLVTEALLGAGLVLFGFVAHDASAGRALYLAAHLTNTQLLLAVLVATAWYAGRPDPVAARIRPPRTLAAALPVLLAVSVTGAIAALGDTLFPAASVAAGIRQEFSAAAGLLLRLRALHPVLAILAAAYLVFATVRAGRENRLRAGGSAVSFLLLLQLAAGAVNIALLAPIWTQIVHLLLASVLWIALVLLYLQASCAPSPIDVRSFARA